ncbi:MAG: voltage-gated chloride channel [bacterium]|nr:voltage-gated chloride channel [bacterium]
MNGPPTQPQDVAVLRRHERLLWLGALVLATGALAGIASVALLATLRVIERRVWPGSTFGLAVTAAPPGYRVAALLTAGALTTTLHLLIPRARIDAGGVMTALWQGCGVLPFAKTLARGLLSIVTVGLGAALGREGALKSVGGAIGSRLAIVADVGLGHRRLLLACGAAAGMAAAYNVPLGGALFGLEVLLDGIEIELVAPMIVCCAVATNASRLVWRTHATYVIPAYGLGGPAVLARSLLFGAVLGVISALVLKGLRWFSTVEQWNARLTPFMPLVALATLGVASIWAPHLLGSGYDVANAALHHELALGLLVSLPLLRFVATATCHAAQVPGGLFTPILSIGALIGGLVGEAVSRVWPGTPPGAFALLGMGALLAGTSRGPISSVVLISELSYDYELVLPLACACAAATAVSRRLERGSLYRPLPPRRPRRTEPRALPAVTLHPARIISALTPASELLVVLSIPDQRTLFVVDERGRLVGALHASTARARLVRETLRCLLVAADLADRAVARISLHASADEMRATFERSDVRSLPVVDDDDVVAGEVCRQDFVR